MRPSSPIWPDRPLLNIRGGDVAHTPLLLSFAILQRQHGRPLHRAAQADAETKRYLGNGVGLAEPLLHWGRAEQPGSAGKKVPAMPPARRPIVERPEGRRALLRRDRCCCRAAIRTRSNSPACAAPMRAMALP
jgi:hypothetical protein